MKILWPAVATAATIALAPLLVRSEVPNVHVSAAPLNIAVSLNIDPARAEVVQSILESGHQRRIAAMAEIRADIEKQLESVLTPEELARLKETLPPPPRKRGVAM